MITSASRLPPSLPLDFRQEANSRESDQVYRAVETLRKSGHVVYRQGSNHMVDGKIASTKQILALAHLEKASA